MVSASRDLLTCHSNVSDRSAGDNPGPSMFRAVAQDNLDVRILAPKATRGANGRCRVFVRDTGEELGV